MLGIVKNPPHPNAMKVFVNWFLGKEGQEFYAKVMKQGTRRLDVDTKWMSQIGVDAAKDVMTLADYHRLRNSFRGQSHQSSQAGGRVCRKDSQQMSLRSATHRDRISFSWYLGTGFTPEILQKLHTGDSPTLSEYSLTGRLLNVSRFRRSIFDSIGFEVNSSGKAA